MSNKTSDIISTVNDVEEQLKKYNINTHDIKCCMLLVEDIILSYREKDDCDNYKISFKKTKGKIRISIEFKCDKYDPFADDENIIITNTLLKTEAKYSHKYKGNKNIINCDFEMVTTVFENFKFIIRFLKPQKLMFSIAILFQVFSIGLSIAIPVISAKIISQIGLSNVKQIIIISAVLLVVHAINDFDDFLSNCLHNRIYNHLMNDIEMELTKNVLDMNIDSVEKHGSGMIIQRLTNDTTQIASGFDTLTALIANLVKYIGTLIAILIVCPPLFVIKFFTIALLVFIELKRVYQYNSDEREQKHLNDKFTGLVNEMVRGLRDVKLLNSEGHFSNQLKVYINKVNLQRLKKLNTSWNYKLAGLELSKLLEFAFYVLIALFIYNNSITPTDAIVVFNYSATLIVVPTFIGNFSKFAQNLSISSERLYHLVNSKEFTREKFGNKHIENIEGNIEFKDVCFSYKNDDTSNKEVKVFNDLSLKINAGETVAFVGKSGCGKSTALSLISKLYSTNSGKVLIDGIDIEELDKESIRSNITMVSQSPYIFNMSVRDNLRLVKPDLTDEEMIDICKKSCIHDDILNYVDGYDTSIGEGGITMSGGQRQRLALARSFLKDSKIVLFDEATSALDNTTQSKIKEAISNLHNSKTLIIVAHRLSTIINCDKIFFLKDGKVLACGTHEELLQDCEDYRSLYMSE